MLRYFQDMFRSSNLIIVSSTGKIGLMYLCVNRMELLCKTCLHELGEAEHFGDDSPTTFLLGPGSQTLRPLRPICTTIH